MHYKGKLFSASNLKVFVGPASNRCPWNLPSSPVNRSAPQQFEKACVDSTQQAYTTQLPSKGEAKLTVLF